MYHVWNYLSGDKVDVHRACSLPVFTVSVKVFVAKAKLAHIQEQQLNLLR